MSNDTTIHFGHGWFPAPEITENWRRATIKKIIRAPKDESEWHPVVKDLKRLIDETPELYMGFGLMFEETWQKKDLTNRAQVRIVYAWLA